MTFTVHVDQSFIRDELRFSVQVITGAEDRFASGPVSARRPERWRALLETLEATERPVIIYTMARREADDLAAELAATAGLECIAYHAGLPDPKRREIERRFLHGDCECIVATNAFGMGIDKEDVRTVIHWQLPATPEALYQEAGRAGRGASNNSPARAVLLFHDNDVDDAYRTVRRAVPTRWEIERTDLVLRELADHQQRPVVTVTDDDLRGLATLRPEIQERVVIAHLERSGLIRELDRLHGARSIRRTPLPVEATTALEAEILKLLDPGGEPTGIAAATVVGVPGANVASDVWRAVDALERRGLVERCRSVSVRLLVPDPAPAIETVRVATNGVWKQLAAHRSDHGARRYHRALAKDHGNLALLRTAIEVLAAFGLIEVRHEVADGSVPAARLSPNANADQLSGAFARAAELAHAIHEGNASRTIPLAELAEETGFVEKEVLDGLTLLHLVGAASVDLRSWEANAPSAARVIEISAVTDRDERLSAAVAAGQALARLSQLRLETLRRYASISPGDELDDADPYQAFLEQYLTEVDFLERIASSTTDDILTSLTETQQLAVLARPSEPVVILAGPGTGKTRTIVSRIAYRARAGYVLPERVLAITFTRAATEEVRARLAQLGVRGVDVRTLDSLAWKLLRENWSSMGFREEPSLVENQQALIRQVCPGANAGKEVTALNLIKSRRHLIDEDCHLAYEKERKRKDLVDYGDVKTLATDLLHNEVLAHHYPEAFDEVYVDEFQDLSPLQIELVEAISAKAHLTIVGDPRQAIYEWNGASPHELVRRYGDGSQAIDLVENFRSSTAILALANRVMAKTMPELPAVQPAGDGAGAPVGLHPFEPGDEAEMIVHVVGQVRSWLAEGVPDAEIAVLAYKNAMVDQLGRALRAASIAAHEVGLPEISSTHAFDVLLTAPATDDGPDPEETLLDIVDRLRATPAVVEGLTGRDDAETEQNVEDWERLRAAVDERQRTGAVDLVEALTAIRRNDEGPSTRTGVTVTTMTRAKGLEWTAVAVTDLGEKSMADWAEDAERCRLVYVSVTRAKHLLDLSWTGQVTKWLS